MKLRKIAAMLGIVTLMSASVYGCSSDSQNDTDQDITQEQEGDTGLLDAQDTQTEQDVQDQQEDDHTLHEDEQELTYEMETFTEAPNENSTIEIQYPSFTGSGAEELNALIEERVRSFVELDPELYTDGEGITVSYEAAVTLQDAQMVSIVFWGSSMIEGGAYPANDLYALNVELGSMEEVTLEGLYTIDDEFEARFFEKAYCPTNPIFDYDEETFQQLLEMQNPEYQGFSPFGGHEAVNCYFTEDGVVLILPAVHATGYDYFEAQMDYGEM